MRDSENKAMRVSQRKMKKKVARALGMTSKMKEIKMKNLLKVPLFFVLEAKLCVESKTETKKL
jgi:hypothetical protein